MISSRVAWSITQPGWNAMCGEMSVRWSSAGLAVVGGLVRQFEVWEGWIVFSPDSLKLGVVYCLVIYVLCFLEGFQVCCSCFVRVLLMRGGGWAGVHKTGVDHVLLDEGYSLLVIVCVSV